MSAALALNLTEQAVAAWRAGVERLDPERVPAPGIWMREPGAKGRFGLWTAVHAMMLRFLDDWGERAVDLGWSTEQLFGVHRTAGALRADCTGALVGLYPRVVMDMSRTQILLGRRDSRLIFRGISNPAQSIPLWDFPGACKR